MVYARSRVLLVLCAIAVAAADSTSWIVTLPGRWTREVIEAAEPTFTVDSIYYSQRRNYTLVSFSFVITDAQSASSDSVAASLHSALGVQPTNISANDESVHKTIIPETPVGTVSCYSGLSWALDRIDQRSKTLNQCYQVHFTGASVHCYIIDTGVQASHPDFGGRVTLDFTTLGSYEDCDGHGTHVAGLVGSNTYGVAPGAHLHSVRVLDCTGSGTLGDLASGIAWVLDNHQAPAIINLSLGFAGYNSMIANLLQEAEDAGIVVVAAAGNDAADSCTHWPSSQATVISVAALAQGDYRASFSDYGSCVSVFAPGQSVRSTWLNGGTLLLSGTSMASPLAAGVAALLLEQDSSRSPATIRSLLSSEATANDVIDAQGSPNLIVYANLDSASSTSSSSSSSSVSTSRAPTHSHTSSPSRSASHSRTPSHSHSRTASVTRTKTAHPTSLFAQDGSSSSSSTSGNVASSAALTHLVMTILASAAVVALI